MTNTVFLKLDDFVSLFSDVEVSLDVVVTPLRQLAASPAYSNPLLMMQLSDKCLALIITAKYKKA